MATNGNTVYFPFIRKKTIRKSARPGGTKLIPNVVEPVHDFFKDIDLRLKEWLDTNPHIQSDETWNQDWTVKTTIYTNVNIMTTNTVYVQSESIIEL